MRRFRNKEMPTAMAGRGLEAGATVADVLVQAGLASSKSEARRLIDQKGVRLDGQVLEHADAPLPHPGVLQAGKRRFVRVVSSSERMRRHRASGSAATCNPTVAREQRAGTSGSSARCAGPAAWLSDADRGPHDNKKTDS